jgi:hypothetical protein
MTARAGGTRSANRRLVLRQETRVRLKRGWDDGIEVNLNFDGRAWIGLIWLCLGINGVMGGHGLD